MIETRPNRHQRSGRKRDAVLEAAKSLLYSRAIDGISIDAVAARAHVSRATIYRYFGSRDGLFSDAIDATLGEIPTAIPDADESATVALLRISRAWLEELVSDAHLCALRIRCARQGSADRLGRGYLGTDVGRRLLEACMERLIAEGVLRMPDVGTVTQSFMGLVSFPLFEERLLLGAPLDPEAMGKAVEEAVGFLFSLYGTPSPAVD